MGINKKKLLEIIERHADIDWYLLGRPATENLFKNMGFRTHIQMPRWTGAVLGKEKPPKRSKELVWLKWREFLEEATNPPPDIISSMFPAQLWIGIERETAIKMLVLGHFP